MMTKDEVEQLIAIVREGLKKPPVPLVPIKTVAHSFVEDVADTRTGPERWAWLHDRMSQPIAVEDRVELAKLIAALADGLPGCSCKRDWPKILAAQPIDWSNPVQWAIDAHNAVNAKLGKPLYSPPSGA